MERHHPLNRKRITKRPRMPSLKDNFELSPSTVHRTTTTTKTVERKVFPQKEFKPLTKQYKQVAVGDSFQPSATLPEAPPELTEAIKREDLSQPQHYIEKHVMTSSGPVEKHVLSASGQSTPDKANRTEMEMALERYSKEFDDPSIMDMLEVTMPNEIEKHVKVYKREYSSKVEIETNRKGGAMKIKAHSDRPLSDASLEKITKVALEEASPKTKYEEVKRAKSPLSHDRSYSAPHHDRSHSSTPQDGGSSNDSPYIYERTYRSTSPSYERSHSSRMMLTPPRSLSPTSPRGVPASPKSPRHASASYSYVKHTVHDIPVGKKGAPMSINIPKIHRSRSESPGYKSKSPLTSPRSLSSPKSPSVFKKRHLQELSSSAPKSPSRGMYYFYSSSSPKGSSGYASKPRSPEPMDTGLLKISPFRFSHSGSSPKHSAWSPTHSRSNISPSVEVAALQRPSVVRHSITDISKDYLSPERTPTFIPAQKSNVTYGFKSTGPHSPSSPRTPTGPPKMMVEEEEITVVDDMPCGYDHEYESGFSPSNYNSNKVSPGNKSYGSSPLDDLRRKHQGFLQSSPLTQSFNSPLNLAGNLAAHIPKPTPTYNKSPPSFNKPQTPIINHIPGCPSAVNVSASPHAMHSPGCELAPHSTPTRPRSYISMSECMVSNVPHTHAIHSHEVVHGGDEGIPEEFRGEHNWSFTASSANLSCICKSYSKLQTLLYFFKVNLLK